jgi:hypothetical protein
MLTRRSLFRIGVVWTVVLVWQLGVRLVAQNNLALLASERRAPGAILASNIQIEMVFFLVLAGLAFVALLLMARRQRVGLFLGCVVAAGFILPVVLALTMRLQLGLVDILTVGLNAIILWHLVRVLIADRPVQTV